MLIDEKINELQNLIQRKITYEEIAKILGKKSGNVVRNWSYRQRQLEEFEIQKLDEHYGKNKTEQNIINQSNDIIKIPYFEWLPDELKNPKYPDVIARPHSIEDWGNADNLRIVAMNGDKMEHFWYRIRNKDVLLIDTNETKINNNGSGVYFATSRNNTKFWVREMTETIDDGIEFKAYAPSGVTVRVLSKQQLMDADFRIIGRVIKNVSLTI